MKFKEVLPALEEGKKIRRKCWHKNIYIAVAKDGLIHDEDYEAFSFMLEDFEKDDWEFFYEPKKVKLRDLTVEQFNLWVKNNCPKYDGYCRGCPFQKVKCDNREKMNDGWYLNKDLYSDKFLDQEVEVEE